MLAHPDDLARAAENFTRPDTGHADQSPPLIGIDAAAMNRRRRVSVNRASRALRPEIPRPQRSTRHVEVPQPIGAGHEEVNPDLRGGRQQHDTSTTAPSSQLHSVCIGAAAVGDLGGLSAAEHQSGPINGVNARNATLKVIRLG